MQTEDGQLHVVFNGEIYNFQELRAELEGLGHVFRSMSDTEVILLGYREWGLGLLDRLGGMFAFALYDATRGEVLLARDPLGIKPLYYAEVGGCLYVASEVQAIRRVADLGGTDPEALALYLMWGSIPAPRTLYRRARALLAGSYLKIEHGHVGEPAAYYEIRDDIGSPERMDAAEAADHARTCLLDSVRRHMIADVEVGAFLSGGVDSASLVGLLSEVHDGPIRTINLSFEDPRLDEGPLARQASDLYGSRHHRIAIGVSEARERMGGYIDSLDQPSIDGFNVYLVSEAAVRAGLKVAVSGVGGDELFGGYVSFRQTPSMYRLQKRIGWIPGAAALRRPMARGVRGLIGGHRASKIAMAIENADTYSGAFFAQRGVLSCSEARALLAPDVADVVEALDPVREMERRIRTDDVPESERVSLMEISQYMQMQLLRDADAMSMRHSLEVRTPLVDRQLVKELFRIPPEHRHAGPAKLLLREAPRPKLPAMFWQRKKQGFSVPLEEFLRSGAVSLDVPDHPMLNRRAIEGAKSDFLHGRAFYARYLQLLLLAPYLD